MDFRKFKLPVAKQFERMSKSSLFRVGLGNDQLWSTYLGAFPAGTNPVFRERTEYDCSCCRHFIQSIGNVVAIIDGALVSLWDVACEEPAYQTVANALSLLVKSHAIDNVFVTSERTAGTDKTFEQVTEGVKTWDHFFVNIPNNFVRKSTEIGPKLSDFRALHDVLQRSLKELTEDSVDTVLELIGQNSLYRGAEHLHVLNKFQALKREYVRTDPAARDVFVWAQIRELPASVSKIRNTS